GKLLHRSSPASANEAWYARNPARSSSTREWGSEVTWANISTPSGSSIDMQLWRIRAARVSASASAAAKMSTLVSVCLSREALRRVTGSRSSQISSSALSRYFVGSSAVVWAPRREEEASMSIGPWHARTASRLARATEHLAMVALPWTRVPGTPEPEQGLHRDGWG